MEKRNLLEMVDEGTPYTTVICEGCGTLVSEYTDVRPSRFDDCPCTMSDHGVPYAQAEVLDGKPAQRCPFCDELFLDDDRRLYAHHYLNSHVRKG